MDRIAACKVYKGPLYHDGSALEYLDQARDSSLMHPETKRQLRFLLLMLRDRGEAETFRFIRQVVLRGLPFGEDAAPTPVT